MSVLKKGLANSCPKRLTYASSFIHRREAKVTDISKHGLYNIPVVLLVGLSVSLVGRTRAIFSSKLCITVEAQTKKVLLCQTLKSCEYFKILLKIFQLEY